MYHRLVIIRNEKLFTNAHLEFSFALLIQLLRVSHWSQNLYEIVFKYFWLYWLLQGKRAFRITFLEDAKCEWCYTAIQYRASTGPEQGFPCVVNSHREKPVFITGNPCSHCRYPVFITGNSLWELLHREIAVAITGNGFAVLSYVRLIFL